MNPAYLLAQTSLFGTLAAKHRKALASVCAPVELRRKAILFHERQRGEAVYVLVSGQVQLHKTAGEGREIVIKVVKPGETFAEVILFEEPRYPVTATALTDGLALKILRRDVHRLLGEEEFRNDFMAMLMYKQRYLAGRIQQMATLDAEERFLRFLREQFGPGETLRVDISKKALAAAIAVTPETLSRLIRRLMKSGLLVWKGRQVTLRSQPGAKR